MVTNWVMFVTRSSFELFGCSLMHACLVMGDFILIFITFLHERINSNLILTNST
jgi:hypothetical protein